MRSRFDALRVLLHEVQIDRPGPDLAAHFQTVAAIGVKTVEESLSDLLREHRAVCAVAAGGENSRLFGEVHIGTVSETRFHADDIAFLIEDEFLRPGVRHDDAAVLLQLVAHQTEEVDGATLDTELTVSGVIRVLRGGRSIRNLQVINQPVDHFARVLRCHVNEDRIILVFAGLHDVFVSELGAVLRFLHHLTLIAGAGGDQRAGVQLRVAADIRHLFNKDDLFAESCRTDCRGDAARAAADHEDVSLDFFRSRFGGLLHNNRGCHEVFIGAAGCLDSVPHGFKNSAARERRTGHCVEFQRVLLDNFLRKNPERRV